MSLQLQWPQQSLEQQLMFSWSSVVVFVDQLSVYGVLLKYLWCNCVCHLWWHRQLGVFVIQRSAVVVFVDQLSVMVCCWSISGASVCATCGGTDSWASLWFNCLCHHWWHKLLGHKNFINTDSLESMWAICLEYFCWHRQLRTVKYRRAEVE